jgi:hypothetical protein
MSFNKLNFGKRNIQHHHDFEKLSVNNKDIEAELENKVVKKEIKIPYMSPKYYKLNCNRNYSSMSLSSSNDFPSFFMPVDENRYINYIYINTDYQSPTLSLLEYSLEIREYDSPNTNNTYTVLYTCDIPTILYANQYSVGRLQIPENDIFTISKNKYINIRIKGDETRDEELILFLSGYYKIQL